jgi:hypothetical protein
MEWDKKIPLGRQDLLDYRDFFVFPHFPAESGSQQSPAGGEVCIYVRPG